MDLKQGRWDPRQGRLFWQIQSTRRGTDLIAAENVLVGIGEINISAVNAIEDFQAFKPTAI